MYEIYCRWKRITEPTYVSPLQFWNKNYPYVYIGKINDTIYFKFLTFSPSF